MKRIIKLSESTFYRIFLNEDTRGKKAKKDTMNVIREFFNTPRWEWLYNHMDDTFNHEDNPEGWSYLVYMFNHFEEDFFHSPAVRSSVVRRLEPAFAKMAFEAGYQQAQYGSHNIKKQNRIKRIIYKMFFLQEIDDNMTEEEKQKALMEREKISQLPYDISFDEINELYGTKIDEDNSEETERINNEKYVENSEYHIVGPLDYNTAHSFAEKTGDMENVSTKICYAMFPSTWEDYTYDDEYKVYVIYQDNFDKLEPVHDDETNSGYDTYGLSMIWVIVDDEGNIATSNTRWNHAARYKRGRSVDYALSREEISQIIGQNFMKVFK